MKYLAFPKFDRIMLMLGIGYLSAMVFELSFGAFLSNNPYGVVVRGPGGSNDAVT